MALIHELAKYHYIDITYHLDRITTASTTEHRNNNEYVTGEEAGTTEE